MKVYPLRRLAPYSLALLSMFVIAWAAWRLIRHPDAGAYWSSTAGVVEYVQPDGPAAGHLQSGDRILAIDGAPLPNALLFSDKQPGDWVYFLVERDGVRLPVWLRLESPALPIVLSNLEPLLIALAFWGVGVAILALSPPGAQSLLFYTFCQVSAAALASGAISAMSTWAATRLFALLLWWVGPLAVHFHLYFPNRTPSPHRYRLLLPLYAIAIGGSVLDLLTDPQALRGDLPFLYGVRRVWLAGGLLAAMVLLAWTYRRAAGPEPRRQAGLVALGGTIALLPLLVFSLLPDALSGQPILSYDVTFLFLLALPLSYGYAIARYRLMRLDRYVSRSAAWVLVAALWGGSYLVFSAALTHWLPTYLWQQPAFNLGIALVLALTFGPLYRRLDIFVKTLFYGGWYDYRYAIGQLSQVIEDSAEQMDRTTLARSLCLGLQQAMHLECACLLLPDGEGAEVVCTGSCLFKHPSRLSTDAGKALQQCLQARAGPVDPHVLRRELASTGMPDIRPRTIVCDKAQVCMALNIGGPDGRSGLLMLSHKGGQGLFDAADLDILAVIIRQAGIAFENARLAAAARQRTREIEQLHRQVLRSRDEERRRLARELHDQILQEIVGLNFNLSAAQSPEGLKQVRGQVRGILVGLRRVCGELRPPALDTRGLVPVMRTQLSELDRQTALQTTFEVEGNPAQALPEEVRMALFRVFQEAVLNVQRHAAASQLDVTLRLSPQQVCLIVEDDGCGFVVPLHLSRLVTENHFGLAGLHERVELLEGWLAIHSAPGQGCRIEVGIPLKEQYDDTRFDRR